MVDGDVDLDSEEAQVLDPNIRRELRDGRKERQALADEVASAKRDAALARAGIDDSTPLGKMFAKSYDGEITVEAIRTAAEEIPGLLAPKTPDPNAMSAEELEAQKRMAGSSGGAGVGGPDLRTQFNSDIAALRARFDRHDPTLTMDEVMAVVDQADPSLGIIRKGTH